MALASMALAALAGVISTSSIARGLDGLDQLPGARPANSTGRLSVGGDPEPELPVPAVVEQAAVGLDDPAGRDVRVVAGDQGRVDPALERDREHQPQRASGQTSPACRGPDGVPDVPADLEQPG